MRGDQLSRQWRVLRQFEVSKKGAPVNKIAELGGTSLRTAYRDLDGLQLAGFSIYAKKRDSCQCWEFVETYPFNLPFPYTYTELMSLQKDNGKDNRVMSTFLTHSTQRNWRGRQLQSAGVTISLQGRFRGQKRGSKAAERVFLERYFINNSTIAWSDPARGKKLRRQEY